MKITRTSSLASVIWLARALQSDIDHAPIEGGDRTRAFT